MELTVLGCSGSYGAPAGGACSGYLVRAGDATIWMDCGNGTFANLQQHIDPADLTAVVITHGHADHCVDLYGLHVMFRYGLDRSGVPVYAPEGLEPVLEKLVGTFGDTFDWNIVGDGDKASIGEAALRFSRTDHPPPTMAVEIAHDAKRLIYTADTGPEWSVDAFGAGADLVLSEATYLHDDIRGADPSLGAASGRVRPRGGGPPADDHAFVADARPGSLRRRGFGGVRTCSFAGGAAPQHSRLTAPRR